MREDRAAGELTAARQAVAVARDAPSARQKELQEFEETKEERRDKIYDTVMGRTVSREQLDLVQEGVARIDEEGILKADNVKRAEAEVEKKVEAETAAHANFTVATKNRMKIDEHKAAWILEDLKEQEFRAEIELEDFTGRKKDDD